MGSTKKVSVSAIINCSDSILQIYQKISTELSNLSEFSISLQENMNKLSEYNGAKVAGSTHIIEKTEMAPQKIEYSKWQIIGYENLESDIDKLETMISNLTKANECFAQSINNMISTACEIDEVQQEIAKILSTDQMSSLGKYVYNKNQKYKLSIALCNLLKKYTSDNSNLQYPEIINSNFTPQSITTVGNSYLVSAYKVGEKSRIYIYDKTTNKLTGEIILNNQAHVGGISYDEKNDVLYVSGSKGKVKIYDYRQIKKNLTKSKVVNLNTDMEASSIKIENNIIISKKEPNNDSSIQSYKYIVYKYTQIEDENGK